MKQVAEYGFFVSLVATTWWQRVVSRDYFEERVFRFPQFSLYFFPIFLKIIFGKIWQNWGKWKTIFSVLAATHWQHYAIYELFHADETASEFKFKRIEWMNWNTHFHATDAAENLGIFWSFGCSALCLKSNMCGDF